jgi:hypothetical protein
MITPRLGIGAVHVNEASAAGTIVQRIDVLCDDKHLARPVPFETCQRGVRGIGLNVGGTVAGAAHIVEGMAARGVTRKSLGRGNILEAHLRPYAAGIAEGLQPRLFRDARAG